MRLDGHTETETSHPIVIKKIILEILLCDNFTNKQTGEYSIVGVIIIQPKKYERIECNHRLVWSASKQAG